MTRRSRNVLLALVVALAGLWLALELAARAQARALAEQLAPTAVLSYAGAGFALSGGLRLDAPRLQITRGLWAGSVRAREVRVYGPGFWWLLLARVRESEILPEEARIEIFGLGSDGAGGDGFVTQYLQPGGTALFESAGCGDIALDAGDRLRMGVAEAERRDVIDIRRDEANGVLSLAIDASSPGVADAGVRLELAAYSPAAWHDPREREKVRVTRGEFRYSDSGYLALRTSYCAQRLDLQPAEFILRHMAAVDEQLAADGIVAASDVRDLYRALVTNGGTLSLTAIPDPTWSPARMDADARAETLRRLNVTVRHDDDPPVMLRLSFSAVEETLVAPLAVAESAETQSPPVAEASEPGPAATPPEAVASEIVPPAAVASDSTVGPAPAPQDTARAADTPPAAVATVEAPINAEPPATQREAAYDPRDPARALGASAPEPPKDSTLALVWRPGVIDRLEPQDPSMLAYEVVAASVLGQYPGRRVRLLTTGGKLIEGRINSVAGGRVVLDIRVGGGSAQVPVAIANVREARLMRLAR